MRLPALAIRNHQFTMVMVVMLTVMSLVSFVQMPRSEDPQVSFPGGNVFLVLPGASPEDMEQQVIDPLEEAIYELEGLRRLKTKVEGGMAVINVEYSITSLKEVIGGCRHNLRVNRFQRGSKEV